jgi:uncharacterized repeat protein (TIGR02543 family)
VLWDGLNNAGLPMPAGEQYSFQVVGRAGEVHFPLLDFESNRFGGPTVTRLNGAGAPSSIVYYDDRGYKTNGVNVGTPDGHICGAGFTNAPVPDHSLTGVDSNSSNAGVYYRAWGDAAGTTATSACQSGAVSFGDQKALDLWALIVSDPPDADIDLEIIDFADVTVTMSAPQTVAPNGTAVVVAKFGNVGSKVADDTKYTVQLPAGLSDVSCTGATCNYNSTTGLVAISGLPTSLSPGQKTGDVTIEYTAPGSGTLPVTATITTTATQPPLPYTHAPDSVTATTTVAVGGTVADVLVQISAPLTASFGGTVNANVTLRNLGPLPAAGVSYTLTLSDSLTGVSCTPLPVSCTYNATSGAVTISGLPTTLAAGEIEVVSFVYTAPQSGVVTVLAGIDTSTAESTKVNNIATAFTTVTALQSADVTAAIAPPAEVVEESLVQMPVTFSNLGPLKAQGVTYEMTLPAGLGTVNCAGASVICSYNNGTGALTLSGLPATLDNGQSVTFTVAYTAPAPGTLTFTATIGTTTAEINTDNNTVSAQTKVVPTVYTVSFNSNGGSAVTSITGVALGSTITAPAAPTLVGYTFIGWYKDSGLNTPWNFATDTVSTHTTLYAKWVINVYTLTYTAGTNGSITGAASQSVNHGGNGSAVIAVPATGYRFVSWSDGLTTAGRTDGNVTANLTVTAIFSSMEEHTLKLDDEQGFNKPAGSLEQLRIKRGGEQTVTNDPAPADYADFLVCNGNSCKFTAKRSGRYELSYVDGGETHVIVFVVNPNSGFAIERQNATTGVAVNVRIVLDDLPIEKSVQLIYTVQNGELVDVTDPADLLTRNPKELLFDVGPAGNTTCFAAGHCYQDLSVTANAAAGEIVFTLEESDGVVIGDYPKHTIVLTDAALIPLAAQLVVGPGSSVTVGTVATAQVVGLPGGGNYKFDWSLSDDVLGIGAQNNASVKPGTTSAGDYLVRVTVTDLDNPSRTIELLAWLRVVVAGQEKAICGNSGCDDDGSRIPADDRDLACGLGVNDPVDALAYRLQIGDKKWSWDSKGLCLETQPGYGLRLGTVSFLSSPNYGAGVEAAAVQSYGNNGRAARNTEDHGFEHFGLYYDFEVTGLNVAGESVAIVVPLPRSETIPSDAVWRKYHPVDGWFSFKVDAHNTLHSARRVGDTCPSPVSGVWEEGLIEGQDCVRLVIEDGGVNDMDRQANGVIADPGTLAVPAGGKIRVTSTGRHGGFGATDPLAVLVGGLLIIGIALRRMRRPLSMMMLAVFTTLSMVVSAAVFAKDEAAEEASDEVADDANDDQFRAPGWFIGGTLGAALGDVESRDVTAKLLDAAHVKDRNRLAGRLFGGYRFNQHLSLEAGYTDLGKVTTTIETSALNLNDVKGVLPASGEGWELSVSGYLPLAKRWDVYGRLGAWHWETRYRVEETGQQRRPSASGLDGIGGLGVRYWVSPSWQAGLGWDRYRVDGQNVDLLGLSVVYQFGSRHEQPHAHPLVPVQVSEPVQVEPEIVAEPEPVVEPEPVIEVIEEVVEPIIEPVVEPVIEEAVVVEVVPALVVRFDFNSSAVDAKARDVVDEAVAYLNEHEDVRVEVTGHTDLLGGNNYNLRLSKRRAQAVADVMVARGIDAKRIRVDARGHSEPLSGELSEEERAVDRRVEIVFILPE